MQWEVINGKELDNKIINKYESLLPNELIEVWKKFGLASSLEGYIKIINPEEYQGLLEETYFRGSISIPIFATGFGDIITLEEGQYIRMIKYKNGNFIILAKNLSRFMQNLADNYFLEKYFEIPKYNEAIQKLGKLEYDECFGYVPLLGLGGNEKISRIEKVKIREHIELITQMVGRIGIKKI